MAAAAAAVAANDKRAVIGGRGGYKTMWLSQPLPRPASPDCSSNIRGTQIMRARQSAVGIGYRWAIDEWTKSNLDHFDILEITVDHCIHPDSLASNAIFDLVGRIPLNAHGIGLSIGTDIPLDLAYLDKVADILDRLKAPAYSEHLAFTRVPGRDLANLLPLPQTKAVAHDIVTKIRTVQSRIGIPFLLENISYTFAWPDSELSDAEFINLICGETGAGLLLDIENVWLNARNHGFDARRFIDALAPGLVTEVHLAGGHTIEDNELGRSFFADSNAYPIESEVFDLLDYTLARQAPASIILERDDRLEAQNEILDDIARIRTHVARTQPGRAHVELPVASAA
jgi:uncharacterized protein (UPF0276 family)